MRKLNKCFMASVCFMATIASAQSPINEFFTEMQTFRAKFEQVVAQDDIVVQQSTGTVTLKKPLKFHWDYHAPENMALISNGEDFYHYDIALKQVTVRPVDEVSSNAMNAILNGTQPIDELFDVQSVGLPAMQSRFEDFRGNADVYFLLTPKPEASRDWSQSEVIIGLTAINELVYFYAKDDFGENTFYFDQVEQNQSIDDSVFEFVAPDDVDVFGQL